MPLLKPKHLGDSRSVAPLIEKTWTDKKYQIVYEFVYFVFFGGKI